MNKIFKILWNKVRSAHVVTDETKTSCGKGRQGSTLVKTVAGGAAASILAGALGALLPTAGLAASVITRPGGTELKPTNGRFDITAQKVQDGTGINRFDQFKLDKGNIANLHFSTQVGGGEADRLLNFVNTGIEVNGTVNALKNGKIGGDLYFISPGGMVVGSTGVINAGSLTVAVPTEERFDEWITAVEYGSTTHKPYSAEFAKALEEGAYPINPTGIITVAGSINAGNRVALSAAEINVAGKGRIETGISNFADMVNIKDESDSITADAGLGEADLSFVPDPESGDILLVARSEGDDSSLRLPWEEGVGLGNLTATKVDRKASITVEEDAVVKATGDITAEASASNTSYDVERGTFFPEPEEGDVNQNVNGKTGIASANVTADVTIAGTLEAGGDVNLSAETVNVIDHTFGFNFATVSEQIGGSLFANLVGSTVEYVNLSGRSNVTVAEGGSVTAGGNITANAENRTRVEVGDSTAWKNYGHLFSTDKESKIPVAAVAVALVDATSNVTIDGTLRTDKNLTLSAKNDYDVDVGTISTIQGTSQPQGSLVVGDFTSDAFVTVGGSAVLGSKTDGGQMGKVTAAAETANRVETSAETYVAPEGNIALAINVTDFDSAADVTFQNGLASTASEIDIHALNKTETLDVLSKTTVGDRGILMKLQGFAADTAMGLFDKLTGIANQIGNDKASGTIGTAKFQLGGAVGVVTNNQSASVSLDDFGRSFTADGNVTVKSESILADHHYEVTTKQQIDQNAGNEGKEGQGAVAVLVVESSPDDIFDETGTKVGERPSENVSSSVTIAADTVLQSLNGIVEAASHTDITKDRFEFLKKELEQSLLNFGSFFASDTQWKDSADEFETARKNLINAFDALGSGDSTSENFGKFVDAMGAFADFLAATFGVPGTVTGIASAGLELGYDILDIVNPISYTNAYVSAGSVTNDAQTENPISIAASVGYVSQTSANAVTIDRGAALRGAEVKVNAESKNGNIAMGGYLDNFFGFPLPNRDKAKAVGATVVYNTVSSDNLVRLNEGVTLDSTARNVSVTAKDALDVATITATAGMNAGGLTISGLATVTDANGANRLLVDDEVTVSAEGAGADIALTAERDDSVQTVSGGLGIVKSDEGGSSSAVGAGVAVNLGGLANELAVRNLEEPGQGNYFNALGHMTAADVIDLTAESTLNVNAIGVSGQVSSAQTGDKQPDATSFIDENAAGAMTEDISDTQRQLQQAMAQNSGGDNWIEEGANLPSNPSGTVTPPDISTEAGVADAGKAASTLNLAAAGSFAWNDFDSSNTVTVTSEAFDGQSYALNAQSVSVEAVTDKWLGAISGAAGVAAVFGSSGTKANASIGGAAAVNHSVFTNTVTLKGFTTTADTVNVASLVNGTTLAEGLGMSVAAGSSQVALGIDAGVSVNLVENTVGASVDGFTNVDDGDDQAFVYEQAAWSGETQVTGGTSVGVAAGGSSASAAVGASVAVANITNNISSTLTNASISNAQKVDVKALASLTQVNTAVGAQVAQGAGMTAAISGSVISARITNNVTADASNSSITTANVDDASVSVRAETVGTDEGEAGHAYVERAQGVEGVFSRDELLNTELASGITLKQDETENGATMSVDNVLTGGDMTQVSVALATGVAATGSTNSTGSAGVLVTDFTNRFTSTTDGLSVRKAEATGKDFRYEQAAASGVRTVNVAAGVAASAGGNFSLSAAGSVIVSGVNQMANATAKGLELDAGALGSDGAVGSVVSAENYAHTVNVTGNASVSIGSAGAGAGAAVVAAAVNNTANAEVSDAELHGSGTQALAVTADNEAQTWSAGVNGTVSTNAAIGGAYVQNTVLNNAVASVKNVKLDGLGALGVHASGTSDLWTLSGNVSVNVSPGAAVGGAASYVHAAGTTAASADGVTTTETSAPDVSVASEATDQIHTLTLGVSASPTVGVGGSVGINTIDRTVSALLHGLGSYAGPDVEPTSAFGGVAVAAESRETIENLGIVVGAGAVGVGAGVAVNTIGTNVSVELGSSVFEADTLLLQAKSANNIETVGVGVSGGGVSAAGSVVVNHIQGDTTALVRDVTADVHDAAAVLAQSDDVIGTYGGQAAGAGTAAIGLTVTVADRTGTTSATLENADIEETGKAEKAAGLTVAGGVTDEHINDAIVKDVSIGATLEDNRTTEKVEGVRVAATSTATYKTTLVNAAGAGIASMQGVGSTVTHAGATRTDVKNSTLQSASAVDIAAGDYANFDNVTTAGGVAGTTAAGVAYAGVTTKHETAANVSGSTLNGPDVNLVAEAKEGVSALGIIAEGATMLGASALANTVHQGSSVATLLENSTVTGARYAQNADYLGRITDLGVAAAGAGAAAGAVSVFLNTAANDVSSTVSSQSKVLSTESIAVEAGRTSDWNQTTVTAGLGLAGAATAFVAVNTIEGETTLTTEGSTLGTDETDTLVLGASNVDDIDLTTVSASASLGYSLGASVLVNQLDGAASLSAKNSTLTGTAITATAEQNRFVDANSIYGSAALAGGLSANVVSTVVGSVTNDYATLFGGEETGLSDTGHAVEGYVSAYGGTETIESFLKEHGESLSEAERKEILANAAHNASERLQTGTHATFIDTTATGESIAVAAREDAMEGAGVNVTVGSGTGSLGAALAASVATLTRHHNVEASMTGGSLTAKDITFGASTDADDKVTVIQVAGGLAAGQAAWVDATNDGGVATLVAGKAALQTTADDGDILVYAENTGSTDLYAQGVSVGGVTAGGMIARLTDVSTVGMNIENAVFTGDTVLDVDRAQTLRAHAMAGYGGAASGVGAEATVTDSGDAYATLTNVTARDDGLTLADTATEEEKEAAEDGFSANVNLHPTIEVIADSAGGGGLTVGVVKASADVTGTAGLTVTGGQYLTANAVFDVAAGRKTEKAEDALRINAEIDSYGGSGVGVYVNSASVTNEAQVSAEMSGTTFGANTAVDLDAEAFADYDAVARAASGALIRSDNNHVSVSHGADVTVKLTGAATGTTAGSINVETRNDEDARFEASSAGGSVIDVGARAVELSHADTSTAKVDLSGVWATTGDLGVSATVDRNVAFLGRNTTGTILGGNGAALSNSMKGGADVTVADGASLTAGGDLSLTADNRWTVGSADGEELALDTGVYGAIAGNGIELRNEQDTFARVSIGNAAKLLSTDAMTVAAKTTGSTALSLNSRSAGAASAADIAGIQKVDTENEVTVGDGASLKTLSDDGRMTLSASGDETHAIKVTATVEGAAVGKSEADLDLDYAFANNLSIGKNAQLRSGRNIELFAGRDASGADAAVDLLGYTYAISRSAVAPVLSSLTDDYDAKNLVTVADGANVTSTENMDVVASAGNFSTRSEARYWNWTSAGDAGEVEIASTGTGTTAKNATLTNEIRVDGTMLAGVNTHASIIIDGLILPPAGTAAGETAPTPNFSAVAPENIDQIITVDAGDQNTADEIRDGITTGTGSSANLYWERHLELQDLIGELSGLSETDRSSVLAAYRAEDQALIEMMIAEGLAAYNEQNVLYSLNSVQLPYVSVDGVTVSGGNISFTTDKVTGKGSVTANAAEGIEIVNRSNYALYLSDIKILSQGGDVTMNGTSVRTGDVRDDFSVGSLTTASSSTTPTISVSSIFTGDLSYSGKDEHGNVVTTTTSPDASIVINGDVINNAGDVTIDSSKDLIQNTGTTLQAAGGLTLHADGNVTQYYSAGVHNIGGDVESLWSEDKAEIDRWLKDSPYSDDWQIWGVADNVPRPGQGGIIAGGDVIISGQMINLNGTVQSGFSSYQLTLEDGQSLTDAVNTVINRWTAAGSKTNINVKSDDFLISAGGYKQNADGSYYWQVAAWYDPVNQRIVLDDIQPEGGHIYISGGISSTGGGRIYAANGKADVNVKVGSYDLVTGVINTELSDGFIRVTDINYGDGKNHSAKVSEWTSNGGETTLQTWMLDMQGEKVGEVTTVTGASAEHYDPRENLVYMWSWGYQTGVIHHSYAEDGFTWWGGFDWDRLDQELTETWSEPITDKALTPGHTIGLGQGQNLTAEALIQTTGHDEGEWVYTTWTTYDDALHWRGTHHKEGERHETGTKVVTFSVKADETVWTGFLEGNNTVSIATGGTLWLGGAVSAENGTVGLTAGGDILNQTADASIRGASSLTLTAGGSIGTSSDAIRISGGTGTMNVTANAGGSLYLDGNALTADTLSGTFTAGEVASVTSQKDLHVTDVTGNDIRLKSSEGNIRVDDVHQTASIEGTERFDAEALNGNIDVTVKEGDLGLGQIVANDEFGQVTITVENGTVFDALPRDAESGITTEERLDAWKAAGILGENGENVGAEAWAADVTAAEENLRNDYARYEAYRAAGEDGLSEAEASEFAQLETRFGKYGSLDDALAGERADSSTTLGAVVAAEAKYGWTQNDLLYAVADAIANPDPGYVPTAGAPNVKADRVEISTNTGSIGINRDAVTGKVSSSGEGLEILKLLAQADVDDVTWHKDGSVTVQLKRPITVESNAFSANASGDLFVQSTDESALRIEQAIAGGALRLTSALGVYAASSPLSVYAALSDDVVSNAFGVVQGETVTIRGGKGGIGTEDASLLVNHGDDGWAAFSSNGDIFVDASGDDLTINSVSGGSDVTLSAGSITSYSGEAVDMGDESFDFDGLGYLSSGEEGVIHLEVAGDLGTADNALRFASDATLDVTGELQNAWLTSVEGEGTLDVQTLSANGLVSVTAANDLRFGNVSGSSVTATAANDLTVAGSVESTSEASLSSTEGTLSVTDGAVITAGTIDLTANAGTDETGTVGKVNVGKATLTATEALNVTGASGVVMTGTSVNPEATDPQTAVKVTAKTGDVVLDEVALKADSLTAEALAGSLDTTGLDASDIGSVQLSASDGMALDQMTIEAESVILTTAGDLSASNSVITATADKVALTSTGGSVTTNDSQISAVTSVELNAATDVNVAGESTSVFAESTTLTATTGTVNAANADFAVDSSLTVTGASGVVMTGATVEGKTSEAVVTVTAAAGDADLTGASLSAGSLTASATTGSLVGTGLEATLSGTANLTAETGISITDADVTASSVHAESATGDLTATGAKLHAGEESLTLTATSGTVTATDAELTGNTTVTVTGVNVNLTGDTTQVSANEAAITASSGSVEAAGADFTVDAKLEVTGASGIVMTNTTVNDGKESAADVTVTATAGDADLTGASLAIGSLTASAGQNVSAENLAVTVGTDETGTAGDVTITATEGDVKLTDAKLTGAAGSVGDVTVSAGANAHLDGLMKIENGFVAESVAVTAGDAVNFGDAPQNAVVSKGDFSVTASELAGEGFGTGSSYSVAEGDFRVDVDSDVTVSEGFSVTAENVALETGGFTADGSATIRGEETVSITSSDDVTLAGEVLVTADQSVGISSSEGGIAMTGAVTVGDETTDENKAEVTLAAKDDVTQSVTSGDGGLRGSDLTVTSSEGAVDLGAGRDESAGSQGNAFDRITVEAAEDVTLATSGRETELAVNESQNGTVNGNLNVIGEDAGLTFTHDLSVKGDATIQGGAVKGEGLEAEGTVGILTALDDGEREAGESSGVEFTGPISGTQVTVITGEGGISLDRVTSTEGSTEIYRVGDETKEDVTVKGVDSATSVTIFNNRGDNVLDGSVQGEDNVFALTGDEGATSGSHHLESSGGVAASIGGMGEFADDVIAGLPSGSGGGWHPSELPTIRLDGLMSDAGHAAQTDPLRIQWMPTDEFFFLNQRPDAQAAKAESDEDEERPALEEGLPARVEPVITDHRKVTPQTLEELGLILSQR